MKNIDVKSLGRVGVLYGGKSAEREVSLVSGKGVYDALISAGVDAHLFDTGTQPLTELATSGFDRVFIALHGRYGEDGTIQGMLEQLRIPYTGSGVMASAIAMNKAMTKKIWISQGLPTPRYCELTEKSDWKRVVDELGLPLIVKPACEGSTIGITKVNSLEDMPRAFAVARKSDSEVIAEEFIDGIELTASLMEINGRVEALPLVRINAPDGNYDYHNKYFGDTKYLCPCGLDELTEETIRMAALKSFHALGCRGWGRVDVIYRERDSRAFLLELNSSPGMTSHSLVPMAAAVAGYSYPQLCVAIAATARLGVTGD